MNLLNDKTDIDHVNKPESELVEREKMEHKLLGTFFRKRGQNLYGYNQKTGEIKQINIIYGNTVHLVSMDGVLVPVDYEHEKCFIDGSAIYFEALNRKNAVSRVERWKQGKIESLENLREYDPDKQLKFY